MLQGRFLRAWVLRLGLAAALLSGCRGASLTPVLQASDPSASGAREATSSDLLYVTSNNKVFVYTYPDGKLVETLGPFYAAGGPCVDAAGDVFITNLFAVSILKFTHGATTPDAVLWDYGQEPGSCAIDPLTGDLAVVNSVTANGGAGSIAIYHKAKGWPRYEAIGTGDDLYWFCGYDDSGNLFFDYQDRYFKFHLDEIPKGSRMPRELHLSRALSSLGAVQWDGKYMTVADGHASQIERFRVAGSKAIVVSTSHYQGENNVGYTRSWIQRPNVIVPYGPRQREVGFWLYTKGGDHFKKLSNFPGGVASGTAVSLANPPLRK